MNILINASIVINIILIFIFKMLYMMTFKKEVNPKMKAIAGTFAAVFIFLYLAAFTAISVAGIIKHNYLYISAIIFVIIPFVIGHFAKFSKLKKYTNLQIIAYLLSLLLLFFMQN